MLASHHSSTTGHISFAALELGLTLITVASAFCWPQLGSRLFATVEQLLGRLARRRRLSVLVVGLTALAARLAILPLSPVPDPFVQDDFSFLLAGDTFASGHLTNPTPPLWTHFESFHIDMKPTYMSMYFPAQGMVLAAGKLMGNPWFGVLISVASMCAAITWMLQAWLPSGWALFGGGLAIVRLSLFSYWVDTYSGGGAIAAIGGALVFGALPRFLKKSRMRDGILMASGAVILLYSRPYEGFIVCLPVAASLVWWIAKKKHPPFRVLLRILAVPAVLLIAAFAFLGYYDQQVFGNPLTLPYTVNRATYASAEHFLWQAPRPIPVYRHKIMSEFYTDFELQSFLKQKTLPGFVSGCALKIATFTYFFIGISLLPFLFMLPCALCDRRIRLLTITGALLAAALLCETWFIPHYAAPFTAALYVTFLQCMRHLRVWRPSGQPSGLMLVRVIPVLCLLLVGLRLYAAPLKLDLGQWPEMRWYGPQPDGRPRAGVLAALKSYPGQQLAIVRYTPDHGHIDDWVYNAPDIEKSKVIWARDMGTAKNVELLQYFRNRKVWLVEPDFNPPRVSPYGCAKANPPRPLDCSKLSIEVPLLSKKVLR